MNTHTQRPPALNPRIVKARVLYLEESCRDLIQQFLHERRFELPRLERHALEALHRSTERFPGEHRIARAVLACDIPQKEILIDTALLILQHSDYKSRALFILADQEKRKLMVAEVQRRGGLHSVAGEWVAL